MSEAKAAKRKALIARASGKSDEPTIEKDSTLSYETQLSRALNWHARDSDGKQRKAWVLSYLKKAKRTAEAELMTDVSDWHFYSLGVIVRLKMLGAELSERHEAFIEENIQTILAAPVVSKKLVAAKAATAAVVVSIQDRILDKARETCGERIDGFVDEFILAGCPVGFKINMNDINGPTAKYIATTYKKTLDELNEVQEGKDKQLVEGYSNFTKVQLKRYIALVEQIIAGCEQAKKLVVRKPRARKAKPAGEIVKRMKFMKEFTELGLKSISAPTIVGSTELWVYNTKYKRLQVYRAVNGDVLTVKGTSVLNYDTNTSCQKTMRKPEQVTAMAGQGKRAISASFKALTTKESVVNGRVNEECILLKAF
jgi:hypothetical protein